MDDVRVVGGPERGFTAVFPRGFGTILYIELRIDSKCESRDGTTRILGEYEDCGENSKQ